MSKITASPPCRAFASSTCRVRAGPTCVRILADFGADVIRIEPPAGVDPNEAMFAADRHGGDFQNLNRNKRSLTLNLKKPEGLAVLRSLVATADVVVENWRPDVKARLGLTYEDLRAINPRIILASISGFGQDGSLCGPARLRPDHPGHGRADVGHRPCRRWTAARGPGRGRLRHRHLRGGRHPAGLAGARALGRGQWVHSSLLHTRSR